MENLWNEKGIPHKGWEFLDLVDLGKDYEHCEICNNYPVRYLHHMYHKEKKMRISVGCVCAEKLCEDYDGKYTQKQFIKNNKRKQRAGALNKRRKKMALIQPDMSEATKSLEAGVYPARIKDLEPKQSRSGKAMLKWTFETFDNEDPDMNGKRVYSHTMLEGPGIFKTQEFYKAAMGEDLTGPFDTENLIGREVVLTTQDGTDQQGNQTGYLEIKTVSKYS